MSGTLRWVNAATPLRRVCGVAALLGLFAMHGLAVHGAMHTGHSVEPTPAAAAVAGHDHGTGAAVMTGMHDESGSGALEERAPDPELLGFAGLCLAILLAGAVAVVFLSRAHPPPATG